MTQLKGLIIGITGQTGAGKTRVASMLSRKFGLHVIDADILARKVVEKGTPALMELTDTFGGTILFRDGNLDRRRMASIIFNNPKQKALMESIIFPHIIKEFELQIKTLRGHGAPCVFIDAPTLFESGFDKSCDKIISVLAPRELRCQRILTRDNLTPEEAHARLSAQHEDEFYTSRSDFVIVNDTKLSLLEKKVLEILEALGLIKYIKRP